MTVENKALGFDVQDGWPAPDSSILRGDRPQPGDVRSEEDKVREAAMRYYPVCLDLQDRLCLVVGDGALADEKARQLRRAGARVIRQVAFDPSKAESVFLMVAFVDDPETARAVKAFADRNRILVNVVDRPQQCSFITPAIVQQKDLLVAISTSGKSPGLSSWIRRKLEKDFGSEFAEILDVLGETRAWVKQSLPPYQSRKRFYRELFDGGLVEVARVEGKEGVRARLRHHLEKRIDETGSQRNREGVSGGSGPR